MGIPVLGGTPPPFFLKNIMIYNFDKLPRLEVLEYIAHKHWSLSMETVFLHKKTEPLASARAILMSLAINEIGYSYSITANYFKRDKSTLVCCLKQHGKRMHFDLDQNEKQRHVDKEYYDNYTLLEGTIKKELDTYEGTNS